MGLKKILGLLVTGTILGTLACKGIKVAKNKSKSSSDNNLGFDWDNVLNHSAGPFDFAMQIKRELKWAWQRVTRGYDDQIFWSFDSYLDQIIIKDLEWMLANRNGSPVLEGWTEDDCHEKWTQTLMEMLRYLKQSTDQHCDEVNEYEDLVDFDSYFVPCEDNKLLTMHYKDMSIKAEEIRDKYYLRSRDIDEYKAANHKKAMAMLCMYYRHLWD